MNKASYMQRAITLAAKGKGKTSPNPVVGAVVVKNNKIISEDWHKRAGALHAEALALKKAGRKAKGADLYLTLEPCHHYGRTPPCVDLVIKSGIKKVLIGMKDPDRKTNGKSIAKLKKAGVKVLTGLLEEDCKKLNEVFIKYTKKNFPYVVAKTAQTLDGKIATASGESKWITSDLSRQVARKNRDEFDAILVGINTVIKDNPRLNGADLRRPLKKIIVDSQLKISPQARLFQKASPSNIFIATTAKAPKNKVAALRKKGIRVLISPQNKTETTNLNNKS